jgi:hypothetical protein
VWVDVWGVLYTNCCEKTSHLLSIPILEGRIEIEMSLFLSEHVGLRRMHRVNRNKIIVIQINLGLIFTFVQPVIEIRKSITQQ